MDTSGVDYNHEDLTEDTNANGILDAGEDQNNNGELDSNIWINKGEIPDNGIDDDGNGYKDDYRGWDFVGYSVFSPKQDKEPLDDVGHGTHVAGIIAALGNNQRGIIGVAPKAKILSIKGLDSLGWGNIDILAQCVIYAADSGARIISNSWGGPGISSTIKEAFYYAHSKNKVCIAAAGNENSNAADYEPAGIGSVIAVSASNQKDKKCDFSNYGFKIDVSAPGGDSASGDGEDRVYLGRNILSLRGKGTDMYGDRINLVPQSDTNARYYRARGTSMACPYVSGVAALILSQYPEYSNERVRQIIRFSADDRGRAGLDEEFGYGRINAYQAVSLGRVHIGVDYPGNGSFIRGANSVEIQGGVFIQNGIIDGYTLSYAPKENLEHLIQISAAATSVENGVLGIWDISNLPDAVYTIMLKVSYRVFDTTKAMYVSKDYSEFRDVIIDNVNSPAQIIIEAFGKNGKNKLSQDTPRVLIPFSSEPALYLIYIDDSLDERAWWGETLEIKNVTGLPQEASLSTHYVGIKLPSGTYLLEYPANVAGTFSGVFEIQDGQIEISKQIFFSTVKMEPVVLSSDHDSHQPNIWDRYIVYDGKAGICLYNSESGQTTVIALGMHPGTPEIQGQTVVWDDNSKIYVYDIAKGETKVINETFKYPLSLYGNKIVWADAGIKVYDINNNAFLQLSFPDNATRSHPALYEDKIIYKKQSGDNEVISLYDIKLQEESELALRPAKTAFNFAINEDKAAWQENTQASVTDIFSFDLSTRKTLKVISELNRQRLPALYKDKMVWQDGRNHGVMDFSIYVYDFTEQQEYRLAPDFWSPYSTVSFLYPKIFKNTVVWELSKEDSFGWEKTAWDIYMARLIYAPYLISVTEPAVRSGQTLILNGRNFGESQGDSQILIGSTKITTISSWSDTQITCTVPDEAETGYLKVVTEGGSSNEMPLTVYKTPGPDTSPPTPPIFSDKGRYSRILKASWSSSDPESGISKYLYAIGTLQGLTDIRDWTPIGLNTSITPTGLNLEDGKTYLLAVKAINGAGLESIGYLPIIVDLTIPYISITFPQYGRPLSRNGFTLTAEAGDSFSGVDSVIISIYDYGRGTATVQPLIYDPNTAQWKFQVLPSHITLGKTATFYVRAKDKAGNYSDPDIEGIIIDDTQPSIPSVSDSALTTTSTTNLSASWSSSDDPESGISGYYYAIGTSKGATDIRGWTPIGLNTSVTATYLSLEDSKTYYIAVKAINGAGLESIGYSDGITVRLNPSFIYGDLNSDGVISSGDALLALKASVGLIALTPEQIRAADVDGSGLITAGDALLILKYSVYIITSFPVEKKLPSRQPFKRYLQTNRKR